MTVLERRFGDLVQGGSLAIGDGYRAKNEELGGRGPVFLRAAYLQDTGFILDQPDRFLDLNIQNFGAKVSQLDDVVITTKGNSTGRVGRIRAEQSGAVYSPHLSYWRSNSPDIIDQRFLYYWSKSIEFLAQLRGMAHGTDMAPYLSLRDQLQLRITLPNIQLQKAIGEILGALDDKIELNRRMNETLEAMARALFKDWFVDFGPTRAKMEGRAPYLAPDIWSLFPDRLDDEGKPEGWKNSTLKEIALRNRGQIRTGPFGSQLHQSDYVPVGTPVVMPANLTSGEIVEDGIARIGTTTAMQLSDHAMADGDIVYGRRGDIGRKALVGPDEAGWICGTGCLRISIRSDECPPLYLFYHLDRPDVREWISARAIGATMPNLNTSIIGEVKVLLPGIELATQITHAIEPMFHRMRSNRRENQTLAATRDFLLPKLMSGEVRIKDAETLVGEVT